MGWEEAGHTFLQGAGSPHSPLGEGPIVLEALKGLLPELGENQHGDPDTLQ